MSEQRTRLAAADAQLQECMVAIRDAKAQLSEERSRYSSVEAERTRLESQLQSQKGALAAASAAAAELPHLHAKAEVAAHELQQVRPLHRREYN